MTEPTEQNGKEKAFSFTDKRRIDPVTGTRRAGADTPAAPGAGVPDSGAGTAAPGVSDSGVPGSGVPGEPADPSSAQVAGLTEDLQRITAEYANYRKRVERDREVVTAVAKGQVMVDLLPVLDDLERADAHGDLTGAFKAVSDKLIETVTRLGLAKVGAVGDAFDPQIHEAVQFATASDVTEPTVTGMLRQGYTFADRLVRPAVVVVTGPEAEQADAPETDQ